MSTTDQTVIRLLDRSDVSQLRALMAMFGAAFEDAESYAAAPPSSAYLNGWLSNASNIAVVCELAGLIVGGLTAYVLEKPERERREIYLYDLAVATGHRRRGIARALLCKLQSVAADRGAYVIMVQADPPDLPAVALYTRLGTREDVYHFDIEVPTKAR